MSIGTLDAIIATVAFVIVAVFTIAILEGGNKTGTPTWPTIILAALCVTLIALVLAIKVFG